MDMPEREIKKIQFYFPQIQEFRLALTDEQMGHLFFAVADYAMTGERQEVERELIFPYSRCCYNIDRFKKGF